MAIPTPQGIKDYDLANATYEKTRTVTGTPATIAVPIIKTGNVISTSPIPTMPSTSITVDTSTPFPAWMLLAGLAVAGWYLYMKG